MVLVSGSQLWFKRVIGVAVTVEMWMWKDKIICKNFREICLLTVLTFFLDVGNWKEGGGRGAMQQPSPSKDPPSPQSSPQQNQIEIQQNGPPISNTMDTPSPQMQQPIGLRPGGGPMHMGPPPMGIPPQYRGMMPPYVSYSWIDETTVNLLYTDIQYNNTTHYNNNLSESRLIKSHSLTIGYQILWLGKSEFHINMPADTCFFWSPLTSYLSSKYNSVSGDCRSKNSSYGGTRVVIFHSGYLKNRTFLLWVIYGGAFLQGTMV